MENIGGQMIMVVMANVLLFLNSGSIQSYQKSILGYSNSGDFPECNSLKDLEKFLHKITEDYNLDYARKTYTKGVKYNIAHVSERYTATVSNPEDFGVFYRL